MFKGECAKGVTVGPEAAQKGASMCKVECVDKSRLGTNGPGCQDGKCAKSGVGTC